MSDEQVPAYIARCRVCGGIIMAAVDDDEVDRGALAEDVARAIRDGHSVERVTVGWVRSHADDWCRCGDDATENDTEPAQPMLLAFA